VTSAWARRLSRCRRLLLGRYLLSFECPSAQSLRLPADAERPSVRACPGLTPTSMRRGAGAKAQPEPRRTAVSAGRCLDGLPDSAEEISPQSAGRDGGTPNRHDLAVALSPQRTKRDAWNGGLRGVEAGDKRNPGDIAPDSTVVPNRVLPWSRSHRNRSSNGSHFRRNDSAQQQRRAVCLELLLLDRLAAKMSFGLKRGGILLSTFFSRFFRFLRYF